MTHAQAAADRNLRAELSSAEFRRDHWADRAGWYEGLVRDVRAATEYDGNLGELEELLDRLSESLAARAAAQDHVDQLLLQISENLAAAPPSPTRAELGTRRAETEREVRRRRRRHEAKPTPRNRMTVGYAINDLRRVRDHAPWPTNGTRPRPSARGRRPSGRPRGSRAVSSGSRAGPDAPSGDSDPPGLDPPPGGRPQRAPAPPDQGPGQ